jgi:hypothetical protein
MAFRRSLILGLVVCAPALLRTLPASAQATTSEKVTAEALFDDALRLMRAGAFGEACSKLEASQRIDPAVGTLLYLAECYERIGRTAGAWVTFREAASLARVSDQPRRAATAQAHADRLQPALPRLIIELSKEALAIAGLRVRYGSVPLEPSLSGVAVPVDPGELVVEASAPGYAPFSRKLSLKPGERSTVSVPGLTPLGGGAVPPPTPVADSSAPGAPLAREASPVSSQTAPAPVVERRLSALPIVLGSVGIVGLGVGSYFGLRAISKASDARDACPNGACREERGETQMDSARSSARISNIAYAVGAASLAVGIVLYVYSPGAESSTLEISSRLGDGQAGLELRGAL